MVQRKIPKGQHSKKQTHTQYLLSRIASVLLCAKGELKHYKKLQLEP